MSIRSSKNQPSDEQLPCAISDSNRESPSRCGTVSGINRESPSGCGAGVATEKNSSPKAGKGRTLAQAENAPLLVADDVRFMKEALKEAKKAAAEDEVPVGAVIVYQGKIIARGRNRREKTQCATRHAEMIAIERACKKIGYWRLCGCTLYVTLEPCPMCAGALWNARVDRLCYGAADQKAGACDSLYKIPTDERLNHRLQVTSSVLKEDCAAVLSEFFRKKRAMGKK